MEIPEGFVDRVLARTHVEDDCVVWEGAMSNGTNPVISIGGKLYAIRRVLWELSGRILIPRRHMAAECDCAHGCIEPTHLVQHKAGLAPGYRRSAATRLKIANTMRANGKLTLAQVEAIRASDKVGTELAKEHGVSAGHAAAVRRGTYWTATLGSPFSGLSTGRQP